jgi:curved DNA-binding protein CbpA
MAIPDYYEILEVHPKASPEVIDRAYQALLKKWHPDRNIGDPKAEQMSKLLNEAYEVLRNPQKRKEYDEQRQRESNAERDSTQNDARPNSTRREQQGQRDNTQDRSRHRGPTICDCGKRANFFCPCGRGVCSERKCRLSGNSWYVSGIWRESLEESCDFFGNPARVLVERTEEAQGIKSYNRAYGANASP